jgi:hypothetical protein
MVEQRRARIEDFDEGVDQHQERRAEDHHRHRNHQIHDALQAAGLNLERAWRKGCFAPRSEPAGFNAAAILHNRNPCPTARRTPLRN